MSDLPTRIAGWAGGLALIAALLAGIWFDGRFRGEARADARHAEQMRKVDAQVDAERTEQNRRLMRLTDRIDELRHRPERVRTVTREVVRHVVADADCRSLPASWRVLWNADREDRPATGAASLGHAAVPAVADAAR